jgi:hypothetical protein
MVVKLVRLGSCYQVFKDNDKIKTSHKGNEESEEQFKSRVTREFDLYVKELKDFKEKTEPKVIKIVEI